MKNKYSKELRAVARHYKTTPKMVLKVIDDAVVKLIFDKSGKDGAVCVIKSNAIH
jgi:hypothetical protein